MQYNCILFCFQLNHVELSPNYAGTLFGITNMVANLTGFITPWVAGNITNYNVRRSNSCLLRAPPNGFFMTFSIFSFSKHQNLGERSFLSQRPFTSSSTQFLSFSSERKFNLGILIGNGITIRNHLQIVKIAKNKKCFAIQTFLVISKRSVVGASLQRKITPSVAQDQSVANTRERHFSSLGPRCAYRPNKKRKMLLQKLLMIIILDIVHLSQCKCLFLLDFFHPISFSFIS